MLMCDPEIPFKKSPEKKLIAIFRPGRIHGYGGSQNLEDKMLKKDPLRKDTYLLDIRHKEWQKHLLKIEVPNLIKKGFDGVYIEPFNDFLACEKKHPEKFRGMRRAVIDFVKNLRKRFPELTIILHASDELVVINSPYINGVLAESLYSSYQPKTRTYQLTPKEETKKKEVVLRRVRSVRPQIAIYTLDYCSEEDTATRRKIYAKHKNQGFLPCIVTAR